MKLQRKTFGLKDIEWKADKPGAFKARIATLNVVDHEGDVTLADAFPVGKSIVISAYMHSSWIDRLPVGKGVIGASDTEAWVDGQFFMDTTDGKDTYLTVKALAEAGLGEWSYGYEVLSSSTEKADLDPYPGAMRILKGLGVFEASPVLVGAGINTGTESIKSRVADRMKARLKGVTQTTTWDDSTSAQALATIAQIDLMTDALDELVDSLMDQFGIPDPDEDANDQDIPDNDGNAMSQGQDNPAVDPNAILVPKSYQRHAQHALASVQALSSRSKALAALRAKEGRTLSAANRDRLSSLLQAMTTATSDIQDLLDSTDEGKANAEIERIFASLYRPA